MKQERDEIRGLAPEEIKARSELPFDDAIAEDWSPGCMTVLTSLGLELAGELLRRDLDVGSLLIRPTVVVVAVVNHCGFPREYRIYN